MQAIDSFGGTEMKEKGCSSIFAFEAAILLGKTGVPESSETAEKVFAAARWDIILKTAWKEGFLTFAKQFEGKICNCFDRLSEKMNCYPNQNKRVSG